MADEIRKQNIILEGRKKLSICGVKEVETFDENGIIVITDLGTLSIKGNDVKIEKLSIDTEEISATGDFYSLEYISDENTKHSIFGRMFR